MRNKKGFVSGLLGALVIFIIAGSLFVGCKHGLSGFAAIEGAFSDVDKVVNEKAKKDTTKDQWKSIYDSFKMAKDSYKIAYENSATKDSTVTGLKTLIEGFKTILETAGEAEADKKAIADACDEALRAIK